MEQDGDGVQRILVTGAAGGMGTLLRPRLRAPGRVLRLLDLTPVDAGADEEVVTGSIADRALVAEAMAGVDAVVHLGGISGEAPWAEILAANVDGTLAVLDAARTAGVGRVVLASSNHAVGFWSRDDADGEQLPATVGPRPDGFYGWSKAAIESLGQLYHDRFGTDVVCLRIGTCVERPGDVRALSTWLSPDDAARLVEAALADSTRGFHTVWGVSANTRSWWSPEQGRAIGYAPRDDAEVFAAELLQAQTGGAEPDPSDPVLRRVGGLFCTNPLGARA